MPDMSFTRTRWPGICPRALRASTTSSWALRLRWPGSFSIANMTPSVGCGGPPPWRPVPAPAKSPATSGCARIHSSFFFRISRVPWTLVPGGVSNSTKKRLSSEDGKNSAPSCEPKPSDTTNETAATPSVVQRWRRAQSSSVL